VFSQNYNSFGLASSIMAHPLVEIASMALLQTLVSGPSPVVICLAGPTGVGKTAVSLSISQYLPIEIISADSVQVYRGMDIGSAKATLEERMQVPHHLLDVVPVSVPFTVSDFYEHAERLIPAIHARGKIPVVVGGTGFYFDTLLYGLPNSPPPDYALRAKLETQLEEQGVDEMYQRLVRLDPDYAQTLTNHDRQKIVRGLEICESTGGKISQQPWNRASVRKKYRFINYFLNRPREILYQRVELRCQQMLREGLIQEVIDLEEYGLRNNRSAMQAIGYRQVLEFLATEQTADDWAKLMYNLKLASRHYVKRQLTWFRNKSVFEWVELEGLEMAEFVRKLVQRLMKEDASY
jgi:tRNA dimethylallyltransferase